MRIVFDPPLRPNAMFRAGEEIGAAIATQMQRDIVALREGRLLTPVAPHRTGRLAGEVVVRRRS